MEISGVTYGKSTLSMIILNLLNINPEIALDESTQALVRRGLENV
jgi:hypothetical protein